MSMSRTAAYFSIKLASKSAKPLHSSLFQSAIMVYLLFLMVTARLAGTLTTLQYRILLDHVFPELVLPPCQLFLVAHDLLGAEPLVLCQRDKRKVHMGRFLVHMHHGGYNGFGGLVLSDKLQRFIEEFLDLSPLLALEKLRRSSNRSPFSAGFHRVLCR